MRKIEDLTGETFGRLTVLGRAETRVSPSGYRRTMWQCRCECGSIVDVSGCNLKAGNTRSCGCLRREIADEKRKRGAESSRIDLSGQRFGRLVVLDRAWGLGHPDKAGKMRYKYDCLCDCGNHTLAWGYDLKEGRKRSCGCLWREKVTKHGGAKRDSPRLYNIWKGMKQRCENKNNPSFCYYGARGIKICDEWQDFEKFRDWATSSGYGDSLSIDRIDVNGNYCPENCRWATMLDQGNNRTTNRFIEIDGISHTISEWARLSGVSRKTITKRLKRGADPKDAVYKS